MSKATDIEVSPSELRFRFQIGKSIPSHVVLRNPTNERHAFKIKTTSPKKFCVRPASGYIEPMATKQVEVIMQSQKDYPIDSQTVKDKFLLLTTPVTTTESDVSPELFDKSKNNRLKESRLRVVLDIPSPPHTIIEHPDETDQPSPPVSVNDVSVSKLKKENEKLRSQVETLERRPSQKITHGFTLFHLLLVAILAFLIGHYLAPLPPVGVE